MSCPCPRDDINPVCVQTRVSMFGQMSRTADHSVLTCGVRCTTTYLVLLVSVYRSPCFYATHYFRHAQPQPAPDKNPRGVEPRSHTLLSHFIAFAPFQVSYPCAGDDHRPVCGRIELSCVGQESRTDDHFRTSHVQSDVLRPI